MSAIRMDAETWAHLSRLLDEAFDVPEAEREKWLEALGPEHDAVKPRLRALLNQGTEAGFLDSLPHIGGPATSTEDPLVEGAAAPSGVPAPDPLEPDLHPGDRLGVYEIRGLIGVGGMGRVYRAFDPKLGREVAIKALARALHGDLGSLRRVEREARVLATLNHPNIGAIYDFELIEAAPYLILELVEGDTLAQRLARGAFGQREAVAIAVQVASALEEAHHKGVVHRDLKPSNVKLGADGRVRVIDFGIAKPVAHGGAQTPPRPPAGATTSAGEILGTAPYMSPEQIRGEGVDRRTDIWAFGCLLYEMLTGQRAFSGASPPEVMAAVLRDEVNWGRLPAATSPALRRLLRRCLQRDRKLRLQDIGDARLELNEIDGDGGGPNLRRPRMAWVLAWLMAAALLVGAGALAVTRWRTPSTAARIARLSLELPEGVALARDFATPFAIAPDGSRIAFVGTRGTTTRLYVRNTDRLEPVVLEGTEGAWQPFFSPDGTEIAFFADRKLKKAPVAGGAVLTLAELGANPRGGSWAPDGTIVVAPSHTSGLARVDVGKNALTLLTDPDVDRGESTHRWPQILPGGKWVLFTTGQQDAAFDDARLEVVSLDTGERRVLMPGGSYGVYSAGRLFFARAGRVLSAPFDPDRLEVLAAPSVVLEGVRHDLRNGAAQFALSETGTLIYNPAAALSQEYHVAWIDGAGDVTRIGDAPRQFREPSLSPDGRRVAVRIGNALESDLWVLETESGTLSRVSFALSPHRPVWTPDGRGITVAVQHDGRWALTTLSATGSGTQVVVLEGPHRMYANAWSRDGRFLIVQEHRPTSGWDLGVLEMGPDGRPAGPLRNLAATPFQERNAALSPDGRWVAYESDEPDGVFGVYVAPFAGGGPKVRATGNFSRWPRWGNGGELYYWFPARARPWDSRAVAGMYRIDWRHEGSRLVARSDVPVWGASPPAVVDRLEVALYAGYDVDASRRPPRFVVLETSTPSVEAPLRGPVVVLNWFQDLPALPPRR